MSVNSELTQSRARTESPTAQLTGWMPRDEPVPAAILAGLLLLGTLVVSSASASWGMGLLVGGLMLLAAWPLWVPIRFEIGPKGIVRAAFGWRRRIAWSEFAGYETFPHGVLLCHQVPDPPLPATRGLFLPSKSPHADLLPVLDSYLRQRGGLSSTTTQTFVG